MSDQQQQPTDSNPLSVDMAMDLIGKWETHPGLLMAIFDAARKLRDEVELLRDENSILRASCDDAMHIAHDNAKKLVAEQRALQTELEQLRAVVAQNNASLASIVLRWIQPSKN